jgi:Leucine-rich repeat (LRR) protein
MSIKIDWNKETGLLDISHNNLSNLSCINFDDYPNLKELNCNTNQISNLDNLPINLKELNCDNNQIKTLDKLPINLKNLYCRNNQIKKLDKLPINLKQLYCYNNQLTNLDNLPINLETLKCSNNQITSLDNLPINLKELRCYDNPLDVKYENMASDDILKLNIELRKKEQYVEYINNERLKAKIYLKYIAINFNELIPSDIITEIINFIV